MISRRLFLGCMMTVCLIQACSQKVCPAYESFFILDDKVQEETFSYFTDSLPRTDIANVHKNRYGIGDEPFLASVINKIPPPLHSPFAKINTIEPNVIYPALPDSLEFTGDELMAAELDIPDSSAFEEDSVEVAKNWHFNIEQENYFNYLIKRLEIPIEAVEDGEEGEDAVEEGQQGAVLQSDSTSTGEKKGFLKGLFKKKNKQDTTDVDSGSEADQNQNVGAGKGR